jgi:hypothetical protein
MSTEPNEDTQLQEPESLEGVAAVPGAASADLPPSEVTEEIHSSGNASITEDNKEAISIEEQKILSENEE